MSQTIRRFEESIAFIYIRESQEFNETSSAPETFPLLRSNPEFLLVNAVNVRLPLFYPSCNKKRHRDEKTATWTVREEQKFFDNQRIVT